MGSGFGYSCRLAIESLAAVDPGAAIEVHLLGERPDTIHFDLIESMPNVAVLPIDLDALFAEHPAQRSVYDAVPEKAYSAKSNLLRYLLLWQRGGVYVDFDIIALRPLADLANGKAFVGAERVWSHDQARVEHRWTLSMLPGTIGWALTWCVRRADSRWLGGALRTGDRLRLIDPLWSTLQVNNAVIGAPARSEFIARVLDASLSVDPTVRYALGPSLVSSVAREHRQTLRVLREQVLYPVPPGESYRFFEDRHLELRPETALIHYVSSNHGALLNNLEPGDPRIETRPEVFWRLARALGARHRASTDEVPAP
jgi:hypothetical protein